MRALTLAWTQDGGQVLGLAPSAAAAAVLGEQTGICAGFHTFDGATAATRLEQGFTLATVCCDLTHLEQVAAGHLRAARPPR